MISLMDILQELNRRGIDPTTPIAWIDIGWETDPKHLQIDITKDAYLTIVS
mgnify:CR=1 FL=1